MSSKVADIFRGVRRNLTRALPGAFGGLGVCAVVGAGWYGAAPLVDLKRATDRSTKCLAGFAGPRGPALPSCGSTIHDYEKLAGTYYTHHDATYRAEELWARIMVGMYENAAIGDPDPRERARTSSFVTDAEGVVARGSRRISFDDLGPSISTPHLGGLAASLGDRRTLTADFESWTLWSDRIRAEEAPLVEGDLDTAVMIATRYAKDDPHEGDLRTTTAAILCMGPDPAAGLELFTSIPSDRAEHRHAAMARNYGEVLGAMEACAARAKVPAPAPPSAESAGSADLEEMRTAEEIRLEKDPKLLAFPLDRAVSLLGESGGISDAESPYARAYLLAALIERDADSPREKDSAPRLTPGMLDDFVRRRSTEGPLAPEPRHILAEILDEGPGLHPVLPADMLARASDDLERIADEPDPKPTPKAKPKPKPKDQDKDGDAAKDKDDAAVRLVKTSPADAVDDPVEKAEPPPAPPPPFAQRRADLRKAAGALALDAGIAASRFGDAALATKEMSRAAQLLDLDAPTANLLSGAAQYVAGDATSAARTLDGPPSTDARLAMESLTLRALALASSGDKEGAKHAIETALELSDTAKDARLVLDARWLGLALGTAEKVDGAAKLPVYTGQADIARRWTAELMPSSSAASPTEKTAIELNLAAWRNALALSAPERLAFRYALMRTEGDAPEAVTAYLVAGSRLVDESRSGDDVEVWLDAFTASDRPRMTYAAYAFHRREAARIRGDQASAKLWDDRLRKIRAQKSDSATIELARFLDY